MYDRPNLLLVRLLYFSTNQNGYKYKQNRTVSKGLPSLYISISIGINYACIKCITFDKDNFLIFATWFWTPWKPNPPSLFIFFFFNHIFFNQYLNKCSMKFSSRVLLKIKWEDLLKKYKYLRIKCNKWKKSIPPS